MEASYEIILRGDRAEAESLGAALLAARTLVIDAGDYMGAARLLRRDLIITRGGIYDGPATEQARRGA